MDKHTYAMMQLAFPPNYQQVYTTIHMIPAAVDVMERLIHCESTRGND